MSEVIAVRGDFPHNNPGRFSHALNVKIANRQGVAVDLSEFAQNVAHTAAQTLGKSSFDWVGNRSQNAPSVFMRQTVWAILRFGLPSLIQPNWPHIAALAKRDHTTLIFGVKSLYYKKEWPSIQLVRQRMKAWIDQ